MTVLKADLCVIGAGSGGLSVAAGAAQLGRKVVLIEKGEMGGDCLNYGCVPSKALIAAARRAQEARDAGAFGVDARPSVDFPAVIDHVQSVIAAIAPHDSQERFENLGVTVIRAPAAFTGPREVAAGDAVVQAKHFVIATGSSPVVPPISGLRETPHFTNETIFTNRTLPAHLVVVGGGPIGCELAQTFCRLGSRVTLIEAAHLLNNEDAEAAALLRARLAAEGVDLREGAKLQSVRARGEAIEAALDEGVIEGSHLLVAVGRRANVENLGLEKAGVVIDKKGVVVDSRLRTSNSRVFAVGDVAGGLQFTHVAGDHASTIVRNILFKVPAKRRDDIAPRATYTEPEIASVGVSQAACEAKGGRVVRWSFADNDRARAERDVEGFVKIMVDRRGRIEGGVVVGAQAGDLIQPLALAVANRLKIGAFTAMIAPYPTRGEALKRAAGAYYTPTLFSDRTKSLVRFLSVLD